MPGQLETERLILRPPAMADEEAIFAGMSDWEVVRMLARPPWPYRREHAVAWLESLPGKQGGGDKHIFAIALRAAPERCIGMIGLEREGPGEDFTLGYWLARPHWGRGLMSEAAAEILRFAFEALDAPRIRSGCLTDNPASLRVHLKLGFHSTGESTIFCAPRAGEAAHIDLMMTRADWRARSNPG